MSNCSNTWLVLFSLTMFSLNVAFTRAIIDGILINDLWGKIKSLVHWTRFSITVLVLSIYDLLVFKLDCSILLVLSYQYFLYTLCFDLLLNKFTKRELWYIGNTATSDKIVRLFLGTYGGKTYAIIKLIVCVISLLGIVYLWN